MNNVYEYGGIADILLRMKVEKEINGVHYEVNEPYTFLKDVSVQLIYDQKESSSGAKRPVLSSNDGRPLQLIVNGVPLSQKVANLILTNDNTTYKRTKRERIVCKQLGKLFIQFESKIKVFVYDSNLNKISNIYVESSNGQIIHGPFDVDREYLVFYEYESTGDKYSFEIPHYPYFIVEIFMKGNTNKVTNDVYMRFDAASLVSVPNFNIINGGILNTPLVFNLIYTNQEEPIIVFEN